MTNDKPSPLTFIPETENRKWLEYSARKNRRSMSAEINMVLENARVADTEYKLERKD